MTLRGTLPYRLPCMLLVLLVCSALAASGGAAKKVRREAGPHGDFLDRVEFLITPPERMEWQLLQNDEERSQWVESRPAGL